MASNTDGNDLPEYWEQRVTLDGKVYFVNHQDKTTQWTHPNTKKKMRVPEEFPSGWEKKVYEDGRVIFINHNNKTTTYVDPRIEFAFEDHEEEFKQRFDASSTALQVLHGHDLSGKVVIITGGNCGIGFETARALAIHGANVIMACRNVEAANDAINKIQNEKSNAKLTALDCDLCSLKSVSNFVKQFQELNLPLHILILNAAVFYLPHSLTEDGIEQTFQVNHLAQFYLTKLLQDKLIGSAPARVVVLSSESHRYSKIKIETLNQDWLSPSSSRNFGSMAAYNDSKLCSVLFSNEFNRRLSQYKVTSNSCHPGNLVGSNLSRNSWLMKTVFTLAMPFVKSLEQAAATTVYCAIAPELENKGGLYLNNCCQCEPSKSSQSIELASLLWEISEKMIENVFLSNNQL